METDVVISFLESFFAQLECFDWSSATGVIRRFTNSTYNALCKVMVSLVNCERCYYSLSVYNDNQLFSQYNQVKEQIEAYAQKSGFIEIYHSFLCHCIPMINARTHILPIYYLLRDNEYTSPSALTRSVSSFRQNPPTCKLLDQSYSQIVEVELSALEEELLRKYYQINHWIVPPLFAQLKRNIMHELSVVRLLLGVRRHIHEMNMKDACFSIFQCKQELNTWARYFSTGELIKSQNMYNWFLRYYYFLLSKMNLYFHRAFSAQHMLRAESEDISEVYENKPKLKPHVVNMIASFCTKASIENCSIILNYKKINEEYGQCGFDGYEIPSEDAEEPSGLKSWPSAYTFPLNADITHHLPNILSVILEGENELEQGNCVGYYDKKVKVTYVIRIIERYIYMVIITGDKRRDIRTIKLFLAHMASLLSMLSPTIKT